MITKGEVTYLFGGRKVKMEACELNVFWAAIPHQIVDFAKDTKYYVATIPLAWFLQCRLPERFTQPLLRGEVLKERLEDNGRRDEGIFSQWEMDLQKPDDEVHHIVMLEIEGRLRRMVMRMPAIAREVTSKRSRSVLHGGELNKVERMACLVAQRYTDQLSVAEIGREVELHPNYAMGLFKKAFGTTLIEYLTHHRISHAQRLLATTNEKVVEVAFSSGFNSISRFNEAFRRACGCTPREYRLQHAMVE